MYIKILTNKCIRHDLCKSDYVYNVFIINNYTWVSKCKYLCLHKKSIIFKTIYTSLQKVIKVYLEIKKKIK